STQTVQRLLDPLWNRCTDAFVQLHDIYSFSQLSRMKETLLDVGIKRLSVIAEIGGNITPYAQFSNDSVSLMKAEAIEKFRLLDILASLDIRDFHRTQGIGIRYIRGSLSDAFSPLTDPERAAI